MNVFIFESKNCPPLPELFNDSHFKIKRVELNDTTLTEAQNERPDSIVCHYSHFLETPSIEIAQCLRVLYPETQLIFITEEKADFEKTNLIKNGFNYAFLLPIDNFRLLSTLRRHAAVSRLPELKDYCEVQILDLQPGVTLSFSTKIYLPLNNKLAFFSREGEQITEEKLSMLRADSRSVVMIHREEMHKFLEYSANHLKEIGKTINETDKKLKLENSVKDLVSDIFETSNIENTYTKSQQLVKNFKEIIRLFINDESKTIIQKIDKMMTSKADLYDHLNTVSVYTCLFGMAAGLSNIEDLALCGLLHDVGKANFPKDFYMKDIDEMSTHGVEVYKTHPQFSIDNCRLKRIILKDNVQKAILQHHERIDGMGFPLGLTGNRIVIEAKVLSIANQFYHKSEIQAGKSHRSPLEILNLLIEENSRNPSSKELDLEILFKIKSVLTNK